MYLKTVTPQMSPAPQTEQRPAVCSWLQCFAFVQQNKQINTLCNFEENISYAFKKWYIAVIFHLFHLKWFICYVKQLCGPKKRLAHTVTGSFNQWEKHKGLFIVYCSINRILTSIMIAVRLQLWTVYIYIYTWPLG